jgi:hypothetical protein
MKIRGSSPAFFLRVVPKIGPFSGLAFHPPTPAVEQLYMGSFNETLDHYRALLLAQQEDRLQLPNDNLDTGAVTGAATYRLADETYAKLLNKTSGKPVSDALRQDLLSYYADLDRPFATKRNSKAWHELIKELDALKSTSAVGISLPTESQQVSASFIEELRLQPIDGILFCTLPSMCSQNRTNVEAYPKWQSWMREKNLSGLAR